MPAGQPFDADVAIVGLGPVGATLALCLARAGLRTIVLERSTETLDMPRAVMIDGEALRGFERIGFGNEVHAIVQPPRDPHRVAFANSKREELFGANFPKVGMHGWCDANFMDQPELEALLRQLIERDGRIDVRLGHRVTGVSQDDASATLEVEGPGAETQTVRASWVIGCDGASSFIRRELEIPWRSLGYDQDWLVIDIVMKPGCVLPETTMQVCDPERLTTYVCVKDPQRRWELQLLPGETREEMERPEKVAELLRPWADPADYELKRAVVYQFHAATADRWREGRVLLAGDSAHQTPPFLGQGLNSGLRDAFNLAWKLDWVVSGRSSAALLDRYAEERDPHAKELVGWAVDLGQLMENLAATEAGTEAPPPPEQRAAGYGQGRDTPPLFSGALVPEQVASDSPTGHLFTHPIVRDARGVEHRFDGLLGEGFAVVARTVETAKLSSANEALLERLGIPLFVFDEFEHAGGILDRTLEECDGVVVRPDRYIFGVAGGSTTGACKSLDDLVARLPELLCLDS